MNRNERNLEIITAMEELVGEISAQGVKVKELKTAKAEKDVVDAEVAKLLDLKKKLTLLDPTHELALKDKKKGGSKKKEPEQQQKKGPTKKELRMQERAAAQAAKEKEAASSENFGEIDVVVSKFMTRRSWTRISELDDSLVGRVVLVRARVHATRGKGSLAFVVLRQGCFTVQGVSDSKATANFIGKVSNESIVDVEGTVKSATTTCSQSAVELAIATFFVVSKAQPDLPFQIADASRNENAKDEDGLVVVGLDTRLNHRVIDLRTPASQAIMRIKSAVTLLFTSFLDARGFVGVQSPKLLGGASEGGSSVFRLEYFGREACLAQSPQLYKQMLTACSDFEKVYEIGPVFRAEDSNTRRHLCEFTGLDVEMSIYEHYYEVLEMFGGLFNHIFTGISQKFEKELQIISQVYPFEPFKFLKQPLRISFKEGIALLREAGITPEMQGDFDDLSTENEKKLGDIVLKKYDTDFFMMDKYPLSIRPFYTMPDPETYPSKPPAEQLSNSFDFFMRGQEIVSGAQRIHDYKLLMERVIHCHNSAGHGGPHPDSIKAYTDAFKFGAFPHGGGGVGLERVVMLYLGLTNIRKASCFPRDPSRLAP